MRIYWDAIWAYYLSIDQSDEPTSWQASPFTEPCSWCGCDYIIKHRCHERWSLNRHMRNSECTGHGWVVFTHKLKTKAESRFDCFLGHWWGDSDESTGNRRVVLLAANHDKKNIYIYQWAEIFCRLFLCRVRNVHRQPLIHSILVSGTLQLYTPVRVGLTLCPPSWQTFGVLTNCFYEGTVLGPALVH